MDMFQKGCLGNYNFHSIGKRNRVLSFSWKIIKPFMNLYSGSYAVLSRHGHNPFRWGGGSSIQFQKKPKNINMFPFESCILLLDNVYGHLWYHRDFLRKRGSAREKGEGRKEGASRWIQQGPIMMQMREKFLSTVSLCIPFILSSVY